VTVDDTAVESTVKSHVGVLVVPGLVGWVTKLTTGPTLSKTYGDAGEVSVVSSTVVDVAVGSGVGLPSAYSVVVVVVVFSKPCT